ncbi:MAG: metallophosphoesterase [Ignavibacteria bacterium]|nr:metallophosphoesterase [Ignavibacteria bacterium]
MENKLNCLFVSDLHGHSKRYDKLFKTILEEKPGIVLIGGDLYPNAYISRIESLIHGNDFIADFFIPRLQELKNSLLDKYPSIYIILGNDDAGNSAGEIVECEKLNLLKYINQKTIEEDGYYFTGYSFVPPTPFRLKDWEKYDVSRYIDPGCVSPEEGMRTIAVDASVIRYSTIQEDLEAFTPDRDFGKSVFLFHSPPYDTNLDYADLEGKFVDYVPLDCHTGSIAIRRFIEKYQPLLTLHGHIHESTRLTGSWKEKIGNTICFNAATDGPELSLIRFNLSDPWSAERVLL